MYTLAAADTPAADTPTADTPTADTAADTAAADTAADTAAADTAAADTAAADTAAVDTAAAGTPTAADPAVLHTMRAFEWCGHVVETPSVPFRKLEIFAMLVRSLLFHPMHHVPCHASPTFFLLEIYCGI